MFSWERTAPWIVSAYMIGLVVMTIRLLMGLHGSQRLRRTARPINESDLHDVLQRIARRLLLKEMPLIAYSARVTTPLVVGVIKPAILLPAAILTDLTTEQVESLLLHELAHIRRHDHWVNLLQRMIEAVLFFHPAIWWLSQQVSLEREHCCDDLAIRWGSEPCDYAESLVRMSEVRSRTTKLIGLYAITLAATRGTSQRLRGRVLRVLGMPLPGPSVGLTKIGVCSCLIVAAVSAALLAAIPEQRQNGDTSKTASNTSKTAADDDEKFETAEVDTVARMPQGTSPVKQQSSESSSSFSTANPQSGQPSDTTPRLVVLSAQQLTDGDNISDFRERTPELLKKWSRSKETTEWLLLDDD